jgi:hypothetical protein
MATSFPRRSSKIRCANKNTRALAAIVIAINSTFPLVLISPADEVWAQSIVAADSVARTKTPSAAPLEVGVLLNEPRACPGYNLITPSVDTTYLFDNEGRVVHSWPSDVSTAVAYLLDNGHLFRTAAAANLEPAFQGPGKSGRFQEFDWDGNVVWDFEYHSKKRLPHHDAIKLPNGNVLMICWEMIDEEEASAQGVRPETVKDSHLQPNCLVEIEPTGPTTGEVVWEWRSWDHLIQDYDRTKPNYGEVSQHPERFDVNYVPNDQTPRSPDWMHVNAVAYNADLDQIGLSSPTFSEIWIIDHSTTTEEARGHTGGRWGRGGDILYRWGNPATHRNGARLDRRLFFQHNIHWIANGLSGEGRLLVFNNGRGRQPVEHSSVDELEPPIDNAGNYIRRDNSPFGPEAPLWSYTSRNKSDFYSWFISGAQRLPNGNTLINSGAVGIVFEVTAEKEIVWKFSNPFSDEQPTAPRPFQAISKEARDALALNEEQAEKLDEIDKELNNKLADDLHLKQRRVLVGPNDVALSSVPAGEYLVAFRNDHLQLRGTQAESLRALAREFNPRIAAILTEDQKQRFEEYKEKRPTPPRRRPRNTLFRAKRYGLEHPAFAGRTLAPGKTLVELADERERAALAVR